MFLQQYLLMVVGILNHTIGGFSKLAPMSSSIQYYLLPFVVAMGALVWQRIYAIEVLFLLYGAFPLMDTLFTLDTQNPTKEEAKVLVENDFYFDLCMYATSAVCWASSIRILTVVASDKYYTLGWLDIVSYVILYGTMGVFLINVTHQMTHKLEHYKKIIAYINITITFYLHYTVEHVEGHHKNVCTPGDPATSKKNQSFYQFFPQTVIGTWRSCYNIQKDKGKSLLANVAVISLIVNLVMCVIVQNLLGTRGLIFFVVGGILSFTSLELVNYMEHYGLERKMLPTGKYQKVNIRHSWNAPQRFTNYLTLKVQRHSDHHENSLKPYSTLLTFDQSPTLPQGYTAMMIMATVPKVFFSVMSPLLEYYNQKHEGGKVEESVKIRCKEISDRFMLSVFGVFTSLVVLRHTILA